MLARWSWILWQLFIVALAVPLFWGVGWMMRHGHQQTTHTMMLVFRSTIVVMLTLATCSVLNLWLYLKGKHTSQSGRLLAKGFFWTLLLAVLAVVWVRSLYVAVFDDMSEIGAFAGWFTFSMMLIGFFVFNGAVMWRKAHPRRSNRRRQSRRPRREGNRPGLA